MSKVLTDEEILLEREGHGRFSLRRSAEIHPVGKKTPRGPQSVITNRPTRALLIENALPQAKLVPRLAKDAMGNVVRVYVPFKRRRTK